MVSICAAIASVFAGAAFSCLFVIAYLRLDGQNGSFARFAAFCITMSFAVIFAALAVCLRPDDAPFSGSEAVLYHSAFFFAGIAAGTWYRIALPAIVLIYGCYAAATVVPLVKTFSGESRARYNIRIDSESVIVIDGKRIEIPESVVGGASDEDVFVLVFETYALPENRIVPFYSTMFLLAGVTPPNNPESVFRITDDFAEGDTFFLTPWFEKKLLNTRAEKLFPIPAAQIYPMEYALECRAQKQTLRFTLTRAL
jgi:hypothetical protein